MPNNSSNAQCNCCGGCTNNEGCHQLSDTCSKSFASILSFFLKFIEGFVRAGR